MYVMVRDFADGAYKTFVIQAEGTDTIAAFRRKIEERIGTALSDNCELNYNGSIIYKDPPSTLDDHGIENDVTVHLIYFMRGGNCPVCGANGARTEAPPA
ncbi:hypothetical protein ACP70R_002051 [Stipagrostis hirtigluma subsp. patula]